jgi:long-chain acyl-CoA synthetase
VLVHGDRRNFVTALITLEEEALMKWAAGQAGLTGKKYAEVVKSDAAKQLMAPYVDELNKSLAKYETIKQFQILPADLSVDAGELTPSLKLRRKVVEKKYAHLLDKMYEGTVADL